MEARRKGGGGVEMSEEVKERRKWRRGERKEEEQEREGPVSGVDNDASR